jgi:hypothetical protein
LSRNEQAQEGPGIREALTLTKSRSKRKNDDYSYMIIGLGVIRNLYSDYDLPQVSADSGGGRRV